LKIDLVAIEAMVVPRLGDDNESTTVVLAVLGEMSRQLHAAGASGEPCLPHELDARPIEAQLSALLSRPAPIEAPADMVEEVAAILGRFEPHDGIPQRPIVKMARAVLSALAAKGVEELPSVNAIRACTSDNPFYMLTVENGQRVGRLVRAHVSPILAAKDAEIAILRAAHDDVSQKLGALSVMLGNYALPSEPKALAAELKARDAAVEHNRWAFEEEQRLLAEARDHVKELEAKLGACPECHMRDACKLDCSRRTLGNPLPPPPPPSPSVVAEDGTARLEAHGPNGEVRTWGATRRFTVEQCEEHARDVPQGYQCSIVMTGSNRLVREWRQIGVTKPPPPPPPQSIGVPYPPPPPPPPSVVEAPPTKGDHS